ncbi:MAG: translesion DNA synthesis-associated protein ImuA [Arenimonas sp.]
MGQVLAIESVLQDRRIWRGQQAQALPNSALTTSLDALDSALPSGGWMEASLHEILIASDGIGELALVLPILAKLSQQQKPIVLIAPPYRPYAPAWQRSGVLLSQLHVIEAAPKEATWAMEQALRSGSCGAVLGWPQKADDKSLRRLQVAAETGDTLGFAFRAIAAAQNPSPAPIRISLKGTSKLPELRLIKCRGANAPMHAITYSPHYRH